MISLRDLSTPLVIFSFSFIPFLPRSALVTVWSILRGALFLLVRVSQWFPFMLAVNILITLRCLPTPSLSLASGHYYAVYLAPPTHVGTAFARSAHDDRIVSDISHPVVIRSTSCHVSFPCVRKRISILLDMKKKGRSPTNANTNKKQYPWHLEKDTISVFMYWLFAFFPAHKIPCVVSLLFLFFLLNIFHQLSGRYIFIWFYICFFCVYVGMRLEEKGKN